MALFQPKTKKVLEWCCNKTIKADIARAGLGLFRVRFLDDVVALSQSSFRCEKLKYLLVIIGQYENTNKSKATAASF